MHVWSIITGITIIDRKHDIYSYMPLFPHNTVGTYFHIHIGEDIHVFSAPLIDRIERIRQLVVHKFSMHLWIANSILHMRLTARMTFATCNEKQQYKQYIKTTGHFSLFIKEKQPYVKKCLFSTYIMALIPQYFQISPTHAQIHTLPPFLSELPTSQQHRLRHRLCHRNTWELHRTTHIAS